MWSEQAHCCQHGHCACGGFACDEVAYVVHIATVLLHAYGPDDAAHLAAVPSVEHAGRQSPWLITPTPTAGGQWVVLDSTAHDGAPLVILLPARAGEAARLDDILDEYGPLRWIAHPGTNLPAPAEAVPY